MNAREKIRNTIYYEYLYFGSKLNPQAGDVMGGLFTC